MTAPLVSVMVPVYQRASLIGACVQSVLAQTVDDLEVIVVDNASTDGTWEECERLARLDRRVRIFRNSENLGPVHNWRRCMDEARGEYGKLLFSDDAILPTYLEKTLPYLHQDPYVGFAFTMAEIGSDLGQGIPAYAFAPGDGVFAAERFIDGMLFGRYSVPVSPGAALFRLTDLRQNLVDHTANATWLSTGAGPDMLLYLRCASDYPRVAFVHEPLAFFRYHQHSITIARSAEVSDAYRQAKMQYAATTLRGFRRSRAYGRAWFQYLRASRQWISPWAFLNMFEISSNLDPLMVPGALHEASAWVSRRCRRLL